jgi:hypothetical protein
MEVEDAVKKKLSVRVNRSAAEAYEFLSVPENFGRWSSRGMGLRPAGSDWVAQTQEGPATICFTERNSHGVLDHSVKLPRGESIYVPLRVVASGEGCELVLTLVRRPQIQEDAFAAEAELAMRDLLAAKQILEA